MPNNTESPDHAGLRADAPEVDAILGARNIVDNMWLNGSCDTAELEHKIYSLILDGFCKGRDSQSAELATLRGDRTRLNDEVNALAGQVQSLKTENDKLINIVALTIKATCTCSLAGEPIEYHSHNCRAKVIYRGIADIPEATLEGEPVEAK